LWPALTTASWWRSCRRSGAATSGAGEEGPDAARARPTAGTLRSRLAAGSRCRGWPGLASACCPHGPACRFWLDLLTTIPFEIVVIAACGSGLDEKATRFVSLLRLLKLVGHAAPRCCGLWPQRPHHQHRSFLSRRVGSGSLRRRPRPSRGAAHMAAACDLPRRLASTGCRSSLSCSSTT
jgi:hypothetical protein